GPSGWHHPRRLPTSPAARRSAGAGPWCGPCVRPRCCNAAARNYKARRHAPRKRRYRYRRTTQSKPEAQVETGRRRGSAGARPPPAASLTEETRMRGRTPSGPEVIEHLQGSAKAKARLRVILETVHGKRRVRDACALLGISEQRYRQLRTAA